LPSLSTKNFDAISHTLISTIHALFQNYDIIHYHGVGPATLAFLPRLFTRAKIITTFHCQNQYHKKWGLFARLYLKFGEWAACKFPHQTIVVSKILRQIAKEKYNTNAIYFPNGINVNPSINTEEQQKILNQFQLKSNQYFLTVGRLIHEKGIQYLIQAYLKIKTKKKLVIVGEGAYSDDYVKYLKNLAQNNQNIILAGAKYKKELQTLYQNTYLYIHPSESEGLPISVLEAMSYGRCVLVSNIPQNIEAFAGFGYLFINKNINDLAEKMQKLEQRTDLIIAKGKQAKSFALENYNWDIIALETEILYQKTLQQREELSFSLKKLTT